MAKAGKRGRKRKTAPRRTAAAAKGKSKAVRKGGAPASAGSKKASSKRSPRRRRMRHVQRRKRLTLHTLRRARRFRRLTAALLVTAGTLIGCATTFYFGMQWFQRRPTPVASKEPPVAVSWPEGLDARESAELLADLGLTDYPSAMEIYLMAKDMPACVAPGPHLLPHGATPQALVAALCRHENRPKVRVTIPEGFNRFTIAKRLENKGVSQREAFEHATADPKLLFELGIEADAAEARSAEGYLFPATYDFKIDSDPKEVVRKLVQEADRRWQLAIKKHPGGWERLQAEHEMDRRKVLTLAAMVEKEAAVADERPVIASVFLNRLSHRDYPHLQSDPTAMYGCMTLGEQVPACVDWNGRASGAINRDKRNVFSTYVTRGLPPGPIANPGMGSIEAVLSPAETGFYFFVAKGKGRHEFTEDYDKHREAVKRLRERTKSRQRNE